MCAPLNFASKSPVAKIRSISAPKNDRKNHTRRFKKKPIDPYIFNKRFKIQNLLQN